MVLYVRDLATAGPNWTNVSTPGRLIYFVSRGVATYGSISQSRAGYRACVSMCSYNARGWEYMGVIPWLLPRIQAKSGY